MCPRVEDIRMDHIVEYTRNYSVFATARETGSNRLRIFLVKDSGNVYIRNGRVGIWTQIFGQTAEKVRCCIEQARSYVPVYKVNAAYAN